MVAVVTGATGGLGREFAFQLAARGYDLLLTARGGQALEKLVKDVAARYPVHIHTLCADLSIPADLERLRGACASRDVGVLINNAGFGLAGLSLGQDRDREAALLAVNIAAPLQLTQAVAARMKQGYILNVGSLAGFQPAPGMASYAASKAFLTQWSRAVGYELRREGRAVRLSVLCPGPVNTGFDRAAGALRNRRGMEPSRCARAALRGLFRGKACIVPGLSMKLALLGSRLLPTALMLPLQYRLQARKWQI